MQESVAVTLLISMPGPVSAPNLSNSGCLVLPGAGDTLGGGVLRESKHTPAYSMELQRRGWFPHRAMPAGEVATAGFPRVPIGRGTKSPKVPAEAFLRGRHPGYLFSCP